MKQSILIIFLSIFLTQNLSSQVFSDYYNPATLSNSIPPSPNAASLGKYAEIPVSYSSGVPEINIPLYTIKTGNLSLPVSLSYHSSGVKVEEEASWVGLGWSLNAGGVITRTVKGLPDDQFSVYFTFYNYITGFGGDGYADSAGYFYRSEIINELFDGTYNEQLVLRDKIALGEVDGDPDIYYFNFGNHTGSFVFDKDRIPQLTTDSDLKIEFEQKDESGNTSNTGLIYSFKITDEKGTKYYFENTERTGVFPGKQYGNESIEPAPNPYLYSRASSAYDHWLEYNSSWYLTKIESAYSPHEINFTYDTVTGLNLSNLSQRSYYGQGDDIGHSYWFLNTWSNTLTGTLQRRVKSISWDNGYITFLSNYARIDTRRTMNGQYQPPSIEISAALSNVNIFDLNNFPLKQFTLYYSNFSSPGVEVAPLGEQYGYYRLKLDSIKESCTTESLPAYQFFYNDSISLPHRYSCEQDLWGYYNDNGAGNGELVPNIYVYPDCDVNNSVYKSIYSVFPRNNGETEYMISGSDRNAVINFAKAGVLTRVNYPLGGYETFSYELNSFQVDVNSIQGCGLRVNEIATFESENDINPKIRTFTYNLPNGETSGRILNIPEFSYFNNVSDPDFHEENYTTAQLQNFYTVRYSTPQNGLGAKQSNNPFYSYVAMNYTDNGKIVFQYNYPAQFGVNSISLGDSIIYTRTIGDEYSNFPFAPHPNFDFMNGRIKSETYYNQSNMKVKEIRYTYNIIKSARIKAFTSKVKKTLFVWTTDLNYRATIISSGSKYYSLSSWAELSQKTEVEFTDTGDSIINQTQYFYNSAYHKQLTRKVSTGSSLTNNLDVRITYPPDFQTGVYSAMKLHNQINYPIEQLIYRNNKIVSGQLQTYKELNGYYLADRGYELGVQDPLNTIVPFNGQNIDNNYGSPVINYQSYNNRSNPILIETRANQISYYWDNDGNQLISQCINSKSSESAYTGFESTFNGWQVQGSTFQFIDAPENVKTGKYSILLSSNSINRGFAIYVETNTHSGYKASVWVKGPQNSAKLKILLDQSVVNEIVNGNNTSGWQLLEVEIPRANYRDLLGAHTITAQIECTNFCYFDDLRFQPMDSEMTTYTYEPLVGVTSISDAANRPTTFEYDGFGRLRLTRDHEGNILKRYEYNYAH